MFLHIFVGSGILFHFEGPKNETEFWPAVFRKMGALI